MNPYKSYAAVDTSMDVDNKPKLLVKVFQLLLDKMDVVQTAIKRQNYEMKYAELSKITTALDVLDSSLDMEYGEIPKNLSALYQYLIKNLNMVHVTCDLDTLDECRTLLNTIAEAFAKASISEGQEKARPNVAGGVHFDNHI